MNIKPCKYCGLTTHYPYQCRLNPKKPKRIRRYGKKTIAYNEWRDTIARPYLIEKYGNKCAMCGETWRLDVDHIQKRGSHPELKMNLENVRLLCRPCHIDIT